jgi:hypothetical protein
MIGADLMMFKRSIVVLRRLMHNQLQVAQIIGSATLSPTSGSKTGSHLVLAVSLQLVRVC